MLTAIPFSMQFYRTLQCCKLSYHAMLPLFCIGHTAQCVVPKGWRDPLAPIDPCVHMQVEEHAYLRRCGMPASQPRAIAVLRWNCLSQTSVCPPFATQVLSSNPLLEPENGCKEGPHLKPIQAWENRNFLGNFRAISWGILITIGNHHHTDRQMITTLCRQNKSASKTTSRRQNFPVIPHSHLYI